MICISLYPISIIIDYRHIDINNNDIDIDIDIDVYIDY